MGSLLQIRDVPAETRAALKAKAAERGASLNGYLLELLERDAARPTVRTVLERARARGRDASRSSVEALHEARAERVGE